MTHEPTFDCNDVHCYSCNEDEDGPAYIACGECGHLYRTAGELRRAYRREFYRIARKPLPRPVHRLDDELFAGIDAEPIALWRVWWAMLTIRAKHIYFCQHCIHDF